ncbi:unnamed protein product [Onchocerca flexuosa]|uniref:SURF6 domain-containing protein n=1 Tax=Onchocerca flexuosa TaxID=387005 RepID=A0A183I2F9_9BILA|nr:unnamed protein product [Onchocerca flexuosa]
MLIASGSNVKMPRMHVEQQKKLIAYAVNVRRRRMHVEERKMKQDEGWRMLDVELQKTKRDEKQTRMQEGEKWKMQSGNVNVEDVRKKNIAEENKRKRMQSENVNVEDVRKKMQNGKEREKRTKIEDVVRKKSKNVVVEKMSFVDSSKMKREENVKGDGWMMNADERKRSVVGATKMSGVYVRKNKNQK